MGKSNTYSPECYKLLERYGYTYEGVERWIPFGAKGGYRKDFLGFADILAFRPLTIDDGLERLTNLSITTTGVLAIQACEESTFLDHIHKVTLGEPRTALADWLLCGNRFEVWGFPRRSRKSRLRKTSDNRHILNTRFAKLTYELQAGQFVFFEEDITELQLYGYETRISLPSRNTGGAGGKSPPRSGFRKLKSKT